MTMSQPHPTQPLPPQPPAPAKKKRGPLFWILLVVGGLVVLIVLGSCVALLGGSKLHNRRRPSHDSPRRSASV
jgi:flagellar basal body-associated protein FliL